ncbi:MAG: N-acetyltransferase [Thermoleophilia bacterium]|nr:N-acetyltransferase [Thermoleophilia bacterium]
MSDEVVRVERNVAEQQYEVYVDDRRAGLAGYRDEDGHRVLTHTEVDPEFGGRGLAGRLAKRALDDAREEGLRVVPRCSYMAKYVERHEEYADLVE